MELKKVKKNLKKNQDTEGYGRDKKRADIKPKKEENNDNYRTRKKTETKSKHSEWTHEWDEAKSGRLNLRAAPMIVQL